MDTNVLSTEHLPAVHIEVDEIKKGRVSSAHSTTTAQLRNLLSERYGISSNMHFLDTEGYPVCTEDEHSVIISDLLVKDNVVRLKTTETISAPDKKSNVVRERAELQFVPSNIQAITAPSQGPTIPGSMPSHSSQTVIMANELDFNTWKRVFDNCSLLCGIRMDGKEPIRAMQPVLKFKESASCMPLTQVYDNSYIRAYMRSKKMESCFVSNDYFDGGINLSSPYLGIAINGTYTNTTSNTNEERTIYSTCVFNHPRVIVQLNSSYLEPTQEFIKAIDNVLQHTPTKSELEKVFLNYGHIYPQRVVIGGHLFHTEEHHVRGNVVEDKVRKDVETRFKTAYFKRAEFYADLGSANRSRQEWSQQESSITFQAVGGNTLLSRNPTAWEETVVNPMLWRIIEQSDYKSVITLLSKNQRMAIFEINFYQNAKLQEIISKCKNRSEVWLGNEKLADRDIDIVVKQAIVNKQCQELFLGWNKITSVGASVLAQAFNSSCKLETLYLSGNNVGDDGVYSLVETLSTNNNTLKILSLGNNGITDQGAKYLAQIIKTNKTLIHLWLDENNISDEGVRILINTIENYNSTLKELYLFKNKLLTDRAVDFLLQFIECNQSVKHLYIFDCNLSQTSKERLKKNEQSKNCKIYVDNWLY